EGEVATSAQPQFTVADLSRMWITLEVRQEDVPRVQQGQRILFQPDGLPDIEASGTVSWISSEVDERPRTVGVRAEVDNIKGQLRARTFGSGRILTGERADAVAVPRDALQWDSAATVVFVRTEDELAFQPRKVRPGLHDQEFVEVLNGLRAGEVVAT